MYEFLSKKEAELAGVKAELFTRCREVKEANTWLDTLERDHCLLCLELELEKLREMEGLRKEFHRERRRWHEDREQEAVRFTSGSRTSLWRGIVSGNSSTLWYRS